MVVAILPIWIANAVVIFQSSEQRRKLTERRSKIPSKDEEARVLDHIAKVNPSDHLIYWLMGHRGLRIGEIVGNHRNGSNLPGLQLEELTDSGVHVKGKKGHDDFIPLPQDIVSRLKELGETREKGPVFDEVASHKDPVGTMDHRTKVYCRDAGLENWQYVHPHAFRHAFGYKLARQVKGDAYKVRDGMRHKGIGQSSRYVHGMDPEEMKDTLKQMDLEA